MKAIVRHEPSFPLLELELAPNEAVLTEAGTMVARHGEVKMSIAFDANGESTFLARARTFLVAVLRRWVSGDHFHANRFAAPSSGGWVWLAPALAGDVRKLTIGPGQSWTLAPGAFVASDAGVKLRPRFAGLAALFSKNATFWLEVSGEGEAWLTGHGAIDTLEVDGSHIVAADHLVAFASTLKLKANKTHKTQGAASSLRRDDARDLELTGRGQALVQARGVRSLIAWMSPRLPE